MNIPVGWLWTVVTGIAVGVPAGAWAVTRWHPPRPASSPADSRARLDRIDRWLYDRYPLRVTDRWRVRQAVIEGRELSEPKLRQAARDLATALLSGQMGGLGRKATPIILGADGCLLAAILAVALATGNYGILSSVIFGVPLLALSVRGMKRTRQRLERARRLNA